MLGLGVFRRKPREFEYKPRYYDPEKEAREERRREILGERETPKDDAGGENYHPGQYIRKNMYARRGIGVKPKGKMSSAVVRRAIFALIILFAILVWILN